jgi:hypothetical protein
MLVHAELVGVDRSTREQQRVVIVDRSVGDEALDGEGAGILEIVVAGGDLAVVDREQLGARAGVPVAVRGFSSSTRSTPSVARIATVRLLSSFAMSSLLSGGCLTPFIGVIS